MPSLPFSAEIAEVLIVLLSFFAIGLPLIARRVRVPPRYGMKVVPPDEITPGQSELFGAIDKEAAEHGFRPLAFIAATALDGKNLCRLYESLTDSTTMLVFLVGSYTGDRAGVCYEICSRFTDGTYRNTMNRVASSVFPPLPHIQRISYPGASLSDVAERHRQRLESAKAARWQRQTLEEILQRMENEHAKFLEYQVAKGRLKENRATGYFHATYRTGLVGIWNFLNPFADDFTLKRLAAGVFLGTLPLWTALHFRTLFPAATGNDGPIVFSGYVLGALGVGFCFRRKVFLWTILLLFPVALTAESQNPLYLLIAGYISHHLAQFLLRREARKLGVSSPHSERQRRVA